MARPYKRINTGGVGRIPPLFNGIQVNTCHNPACSNFGVEPLPVVSRGRNPRITDDYNVHGRDGTGKSRSALRCKVCGDSFAVKSNRAVAEERDRLLLPFAVEVARGCLTPGCANEGYSASDHKDRYQRFGKTESGSRRYRCRACWRTFSVTRKSTHRQRQPEKNPLIFRLLINKSPMRRICEVADVRPAVLYNRIAFIHKQCDRFAARQERILADGKEFEHLRIAVDRQDHLFNWRTQFDRRNTQLTAVASAECTTGYVFGMHLDYEPRLDSHEIDLHARSINDYALEHPFRRYARVFLPGDYDSDTLRELPDTEGLPAGTRLPANGMRIYPEYTLHGHFYFLRRFLAGAHNIHFYLDQEAGIRNACFSAYRDLITANRIEAFYVRINKDMTVDDKKLALARSGAVLEKHYSGTGRRKRWALAIKMMQKEYMALCRSQPDPLSRWIRHPLPHMGEPDKAVCYISDRGNADPKVVARHMMQASLHAIDRFFMQLRRRVSLLERPIVTASAARRTWYGYSGYNPEIAARLMAIFRVAYNYAIRGEDRKTPAMRLGLMNRIIPLEEILDCV